MISPFEFIYARKDIPTSLPVMFQKMFQISLFDMYLSTAFLPAAVHVSVFTPIS